MKRDRPNTETNGESQHMRKLLHVVPILVAMLSSAAADAALLISEGFEGPSDFKFYPNSNTLQTIPNFVGPGFTKGYGDAKWDIAKETNGCKSGNQCIKVCGEYVGGTCEFWTNEFNPTKTELWVTWWEKLSSTYDINEGHKWFYIQGSFAVGNRLNWQTWNGSTNNELVSRVYNSYNWNCEPAATFATTTSIKLPLNQWYQYKVHVKLNSAGQSDGAWQVWMKTDGTNWTNLWNLTNRNNIRCGGFTENIHGIQFNGTRGAGGQASFGTKWIDDIKVGTTEADVDSGGSGASSIAAPGNLHFTN